MQINDCANAIISLLFLLYRYQSVLAPYALNCLPIQCAEKCLALDEILTELPLQNLSIREGQPALPVLVVQYKMT